jgi:putative transposase
MRKESFTVGNYIHVYNRGNKKMPIVRDEKDRWRFLQTLRYFNDVKSSANVLRNLTRKERLTSDFNQQEPESVFHIGWPKDWPEHNPLVKILCYCLMPNHYHLLLKEIQEGGVSKFMRKIGIGYTKYSNIKYDEVGSVFQGGYKARTVDNDIYLKYLSVYIQVINTFELYPGGFKKAINNFDDALDFSVNYPFCSLADYIGKRESLIINKDILGEMFLARKDYKKFIYESVMIKNVSELLDESLKMD